MPRRQGCQEEFADDELVELADAVFQNEIGPPPADPDARMHDRQPSDDEGSGDEEVSLPDDDLISSDSEGRSAAEEESG